MTKIDRELIRMSAERSAAFRLPLEVTPEEVLKLLELVEERETSDELELRDLQSEVERLNDDLSGAEEEVRDLEARVDGLEEEREELKSRIAAVHTAVAGLN